VEPRSEVTEWILSIYYVPPSSTGALIRQAASDSFHIESRGSLGRDLLRRCIRANTIRRLLHFPSHSDTCGDIGPEQLSLSGIQRVDAACLISVQSLTDSLSWRQRICMLPAISFPKIRSVSSVVCLHNLSTHPPALHLHENLPSLRSTLISCIINVHPVSHHLQPSPDSVKRLLIALRAGYCGILARNIYRSSPFGSTGRERTHDGIRGHPGPHGPRSPRPRKETMV